MRIEAWRRLARELRTSSSLGALATQNKPGKENEAATVKLDRENAAWGAHLPRDSSKQENNSDR
jgi:hypothetical protein